MKICFVQYNLGATSETFLSRHIKLLRQYYDVYCVAGKIHNDTILEASKVYEYTDINFFALFYNRVLSKFNKDRFLYSNSIYKRIHKIKPDLVVFQFSFLPVLIYKEIAKLPYPFVVIHHGTDLNNARYDNTYLHKLRIVWSKANRVVFVSNFLKEEAMKLGLAEHKVKVIYLGVPIGNNQIKANIDSVEDGKRFKSDIFHVLSVGRLVAVKNQAFLISAFKNFNKKYPDSKLTIIGDGKLRNSIENLIIELGLSGKVFLKGAIEYSEVEFYLDKADVFCLTSKKIVTGNSCQEEGLGLTLLEASLKKVPLIGTRSGGIPEIITSNENGFLVNSDNKQEMFAALEYFYLNPNKARMMGDKAQQVVFEKFNQDVQIEKFRALYTDVLKENSH